MEPRTYHEKVKEKMDAYVYLVYKFIKNFPSVTDREFLSETMNYFGGSHQAVIGWVKYKKEIKDLGDVILE